MVSLRRRRLLGQATGPIPLYCENFPASRKSPQNDKPGTEDPMPSDDATILYSSHRSFMSTNPPPVFIPAMLSPYSSCTVPQASHPQQDQAATSKVPPLPGIIDPSDNRMWVEPTHSSFLPFDDVQPIISLITERKYEILHTSHIYIIKELKGKWYKEFKKKCKWLPEYDIEARKTWSKKTATLLGRARIKFRMGKNLSLWLPSPILEEMKRKWGDPISKEKCKKNKNNKAVDDGGSLNRGGSIVVSEHNRKMKEELDEEPEQVELLMCNQERKNKGGITIRS